MWTNLAKWDEKWAKCLKHGPALVADTLGSVGTQVIFKKRGI